MKISKEFKVGILVAVGILLLYTGVNFLKGNSIFKEDRVYFAEFNNSHGLQVSNDVVLNGVKIGTVKSIVHHPSDPRKILVTFSLMNDEILVPTGSEINLISSDFLGTKALSLEMNMTPVDSVVYHISGDTLRTLVQKDITEQINEELLPLKRRTEELIESVEGIIVSVNSFWDTSAAYTIETSLYEFRDAIAKFGGLANSMSTMINEEIMVVDEVLNNVKDITGNISAKSSQINHTIDNIDSITSTLAASDIRMVVEETGKTLSDLNKVLIKVNNGEGSIGALLHTDSLHNELLRTTQSMQNLLNDMEANPKKYVHFSIFGRK